MGWVRVFVGLEIWLDWVGLGQRFGWDRDLVGLQFLWDLDLVGIWVA